MIDACHALNVVISKDFQASPGETELLQYTATEGNELALRVGHMLSGELLMWGLLYSDQLTCPVLAASLSMEYPLSDTLPRITHTREVEVSSKELDKLYEALGEKVLKLQ